MRTVSLRHLALALCLTTAVHAQTQWEQLSKQHSPLIPTNTTAMVSGDIDGDGDNDIIVGMDGQNLLLRNTGDAIFTAATGAMPTRGGRTQGFALVDVDGDLDLDLITVNSSQVLRVDLNDGAGTFTERPNAFTNVPAMTTCIAAADVDGDGDIDVMVGANQSWDLLYLNDGTGQFTDGTTGAQLPRLLQDTRCLAWLDIEGDGDQDLFVGVYGGQNLLFRNNGSGVFNDITGNLPTANDTIEGVAVGDLDGDGDMDLMSADDQDRLWQNSGSGVFSDVTGTQMPADPTTSRAVSLADLDNDGDLDAIFANRNNPSALLRNDSGTFINVTATGWARRPQAHETIIAVDLDGDTWTDLVFGTFGAPDAYPDRLLLNLRGLAFLDAERPRVSESAMLPLGVAVGDLNGDGAPDVFQVGRGVLGLPSAGLLLNDGHGDLRDAPGQVPTPNGDQNDIALVDVDGDNDLDALISGSDSLLLNDGSGLFIDATATQMPSSPGGSVAIAAGDVDGDGDIDAVLGVTDFFNGGQNRLLLNDGSGRFTDASAQLPALSDFTVEVLLVDFDGDSDLDLYVANSGSAGGRTDRLHRNDGNGTFTDISATNLPNLTGTIRGATACDVDGDGDQDIFCTLGLPGAGATNRLLRNNGSGSFSDVSATQLPGLSANSFEVVCVDAERDGDIDLLVVNGGINGTPALYENDGTGVFTDGSSRLPAIRGAFLTPLDADRDGDDDLFVSRWNSPSSLLVNRLRQLEAPFRPRINRRFAIDLHGVGSGAVQNGFWAIGVAGAPSNPNLPLPTTGTLWLDLAFSIDVSPVLAVAPGAGLSRIEFTVPNTPGLLGVGFGIQALFQDSQSPLNWRFSNLLRETVTR